MDEDDGAEADVDDDEEEETPPWKPASCVMTVELYSSSTMVSSFAGGRGGGALPEPEIGCCQGAASEKTPSLLRERDELRTTWSRNDALWILLAIVDLPPQSLSGRTKLLQATRTA